MGACLVKCSLDLVGGFLILDKCHDERKAGQVTRAQNDAQNAPAKSSQQGQGGGPFQGAGQAFKKRGHLNGPRRNTEFDPLGQDVFA